MTYNEVGHETVCTAVESHRDLDRNGKLESRDERRGERELSERSAIVAAEWTIAAYRAVELTRYRSRSECRVKKPAMRYEQDGDRRAHEGRRWGLVSCFSLLSSLVTPGALRIALDSRSEIG